MGSRSKNLRGHVVDRSARIRRAAVEALESRQLMSGTTQDEASTSGASSVGLIAAALAQPSVSSVNPDNGSTGFVRDGFVSAEVSVPNGGIRANSLTASTVYLKKTSNNVVVPAVLNTTGGGDAIILRPTGALEANTNYTFVVTSGLKDAADVGFVPFTSTFTTGTGTSVQNNQIKFEQVQLSITNGEAYTSLQIGPDGKLYGATLDGEIYRWVINSTNGTLSNEEMFDTIAPGSAKRFITGILFDKASTPSNPILWVNNSESTFNDAANWTSKLTKLSDNSSGADLAKVEDKIINLPRSAKDHLNNQMAWGPDGALYFNQGREWAMGAPDSAWGNRQEELLSAAILRLDTTKLPASGSLNVKTRDGGSYNPNATNAALTIYATGVRNAYDLVWHTNGHLYVPTNGSAAGGNTPGGGGVPSRSNLPAQNDYLFDVVQNKYYGHPNPLRSEYVLNGGNPTSGTDPAQVSAYPVGTQPDADWGGFAYNFGLHASPNGAIEYKSNAFGGALKGKLLVTRYSGQDDVIALVPTGVGNGFEATGTISGFTGFNNPLDIIENTTNGYLYVAEFGPEDSSEPSGGQRITLLRPVSVSTETTFSTDIGNLTGKAINSPAAGSLSKPTASTIRITAAGANIDDTADGFYFASQQKSGDFDLRVRVDSLTNTSSTAKAGIMAASLNADAVHVFSSTTAGSTFRLSHRDTTGGDTLRIDGPARVMPGFLRLVREGNTFIGYHSTNGTTWTETGRLTMANMPPTVYLGLAASSATSGTTLTTANFSQLASVAPVVRPSVSVVATDNAAAESGAANTATYTLTRTGPTTNALVVKYAMTGTATNGTDYALLNGTVTIPAGSASATVTLTPTNDLDVEGAETAVLTLVADAAYDMVAPLSDTATIDDNGDLPPTVGVVATTAAADEGGAAGLFTFTRNGPTTADLVVSYSVGGTAAPTDDYSPLTGSVTIPAGQSSATVTVTPVDDSLVEPSETVVVTVTDIIGYNPAAGAAGTATVNLADNEPTVGVVANPAAAAENGAAGAFEISRTGGSTAADLLVSYTIGGTATSGDDYAAIAGTVIIPAGQSSVTVVVTPLDDATVEPGETVTLTITGSTSYTPAAGAAGTATVTIADDEPTVSVIANPADAAEGGAAGTFIISRTGSTAADLLVSYTIGGSATSGDDYTPIDATVLIPAGQSSVNVAVSPVDDNVVEPTETVTLTITGTTTFSAGGSTATVNIADNEPRVSVVANPAGAAEGGASGAFVISRTGSTALDLVVSYTVGGSATATDDYAALTGTATIPAGESSVTINVAPVDDTLASEGSETVTLTLVAGAEYGLGGEPTATVTIADNDAPPTVTVTAHDPAAAEAGQDAGVYRISRTGTTGALSVLFNFSGSAVAGDFTSSTAPLTSVTIPDGASFADVTIVPVDDASYEGSETAILTIAANGAYVIGSGAGAATVTIADNDAAPAIPLTGVNINNRPAGSSSVITGGYQVIAGGSNLSGNADGLRLLYRQQTGNFDVTVKVDSFTAAVASAKAGLMARENLTAGSRHVSAIATQSDGFRTLSRTSAMGQSVTNFNSGTPDYTTGVYLRLRRVSNTFTTFYSSNGTDWTQMSVVTMSLPQTVYLGLATSAATTTSTVTARYLNFGDFGSQPVTPLAAPATLSAIAASPTQVNLSWGAVAGATSYHIQRRVAGQSAWTDVADVTGATTYSNTGLTPDTVYEYHVNATDGTRVSAYSSIDDATTPPDITPTGLPAPANLDAVAASMTQINLSWEAVLNATSYHIQRRVVGQSAWTDVTDVAGTTYQNTGLAASTAYEYRVNATDGTRVSPYSNIDAATTLAAPHQPETPTGLIAQGVSTSEIEVSWNGHTHGDLVFRVQYKLASAADIDGSYTDLGTTADEVFSINGLATNTAYTVRIRGEEGGLVSVWVSTNATTLAETPLVAPAGVTATPQTGPTRVVVSWSAVSGATLYRVQRKLASQSDLSFADVGTSTTTSLTDNGVADGTAYVYRVRAEKTGNNSVYSDPANATTAAAGIPSTDINTTPAGSTTSVTGGYDVTTFGLDIYGTADSFRFLHQSRTGDFDVRVRIDSFTAPVINAKAGLMARENLNANSRNVFSGITDAEGYRFGARTSTGGTTSNIYKVGTVVDGAWVRLKRVGNVFTGYFSTNGTNWTQMGTSTIAMPATIQLGLAQSSKSASQSSTAKYRDYGNTPATPAAATISWTSGPSVPVATAESGTVQIGNKLYVVGGYGSGLIGLRDVRVLNLDTNQWSTLQSLPSNTAVTHFGMATDGRFIYVVAGQAGNGGSTDMRSESWRYNIATNQWTAWTSLPAKRGGGGLVFVNNQLHWFSGFREDRITHATDHWAINVDANGNAVGGWVLKAPVPLSADHFGIAEVNGIVYLIGGEHDHGDTYQQHNTMQAYNPATDTWQQRATLPTASSHFEGGVQVINGRIVVLGGMKANEEIFAEGRVYDPATNSWTVISGIPYGRKGGISAWYNNKLYYATGNGYNGSSTKAYQTNGWSGTINNLWPAP